MASINSQYPWIPMQISYRHESWIGCFSMQIRLPPKNRSNKNLLLRLCFRNSKLSKISASRESCVPPTSPPLFPDIAVSRRRGGGGGGGSLRVLCINVLIRGVWVLTRSSVIERFYVESKRSGWHSRAPLQITQRKSPRSSPQEEPSIAEALSLARSLTLSSSPFLPLDFYPPSLFGIIPLTAPCRLISVLERRR